MTTIAESDIEEVALDWLSELGYTVLHGPDIAPDTPDAERSTYSEVILKRRLRDAVAHLNPNIPRRSTRRSDPKSASSRFPRINPEQPCISSDADRWDRG